MPVMQLLRFPLWPEGTKKALDAWAVSQKSRAAIAALWQVGA